MRSNTASVDRRRSDGPGVAVVALLTVACAVSVAPAQVVEPPFDADYVLVDLGPVPGLPSANGGLAFMPGDTATLVVAGAANSTDGALYTVGVVRDPEGHVVGFGGEAAYMTDAPYVDGGVAFGPGGVVFLSRYPMNEVGQTMPGSLAPDRVVLLDELGVMPSPGGLGFVPEGHPGAGELKIASWDGGQWYTLGLAPDGGGTYDLTSATMGATIGGGPEGFVYVPPGSPQFPDNDRLLISEWSDGNIAVYAVDDAGNPITSSRQVFVSDLMGPEGAVVDPLSGDFLFSTFTGADEHVFAVRGFAVPEEPDDPEDPSPPTCESFALVGHGYWHRQCLGLPVSDGGLAPGKGRGPKQPIEPAFADELLPCADAMLAELGASDEATCEALDPFPTNQSCEQAERDLAALVLDVCSDRVQAGCAIEAERHGCSAGTVGELLQQAADLIADGDCRQASRCVHGMKADDESDADPGLTSLQPIAPPAPGPHGRGASASGDRD